MGVITEKSRTLSLLETNAADDVAGYLRAAFGDPLYCCNSISVVFTGLAGWLCESDRRQEEHWHTLPLYFFGEKILLVIQSVVTECIQSTFLLFS